jgi:hypothetical protein
MDFSKAFDTVPHKKLLDIITTQYGITGNIHDWIKPPNVNNKLSLLAHHHHHHVYSGFRSSTGDSLRTAPFLCHINDLPSTVSSQVRLFDRNTEDRKALQKKTKKILKHGLKHME